MTPQNGHLPQAGGRVFLAYVGMETDLIFNQGIDLPGFASFPLLETEDGRRRLRGYCTDMISLARAHNLGVILESPTWVANRDRGAAIGYDLQTLAQRNRQGVALMADARAGEDDVPIIISANVGPRSDAYAPAAQMSAEDAEYYHAEQIGILSETEVDVISGYTLAYPEEAIGIVRAAQQSQLPVIISFTVETDGCLPTGMPIGNAIEAVDAATEGYASYFMINCAHPDHIAGTLTGQAWMKRLRGVVANASRCSHAELDKAEVLDDGNPEELGQQLAEIHRKHPAIAVLGGCCGTDLRHMKQIAQAVA
ncbi:homocysteine S-methyltransferase family protein [Loktanella sp. Alg231-35]|uniref:homocysteine S-methyltransferase family protein n=1 Tax=Loktanella sp. Alg231-35 TaxID=1922220 RepID=UPI000D560B4D|nr:homocysteine S-methyltransferase family protein [Loktanella sp. Alg231-35]